MRGPRQNHQIVLLQGGREYFPALLDAIDAAQHEVRLETYIFHFDASGAPVAAALERAANRGVQVYLVVDGVGTPDIPGEWVDRLNASGVSWRVFLPLRHLGVFIPNRWRRLHRKLCVIDGSTAFCGGINVLDDFSDPGADMLSEPRLDFAVKVTGPLVRDALDAMTRFWWRMTVAADVRDRDIPAAWHALQQQLHLKLSERKESGLVAALHNRPPGPQRRGARANLVLRDNLRNRRRIERTYLRAIGVARTEVIIANAYFLPGVRLRKALIHAASRGVRVRLLLQGRYEYFLQYHGSRPVIGLLLAAGVEIHEYAASYLHAKVAVIDARWATVGSSNLDPLSMLLAREANVVVHDREFASLLRMRLEQAMEHGGRKVDAAAFANRSLRQRTLEFLAFMAMRAGLFLIGRRY